MPLQRKKPHKLLEPPKDLEPHELVYQVRFTKEIFRDYQSYLKRINLYRKRIWTCKSTGKTNLTYEEAIVSERHTSEKVQALPKELVAPALCIIQFSVLSLKDLADKIASNLQECFFVGAELYGKRGGDLYPCKILKIVEEGARKTQYEVVWLDKDKEIYGNTMLSKEDLSWKKFPFSRNFFKSFIRESTSRNIPWVIHGYLARKHGVSTQLPEELRGKYVFQDGQLVYRRKRKKTEEEREENGRHKKKKVENGQPEDNCKEANEFDEEPINYPIEDLLVQPAPDDPDFTDRPSPSRDFNVPMDCVGDLLMVWDFCSSFSRQLHLWPFTLEDFENAVCHKESNLVFMVEVHACLFRFLIKDNGDYSLALHKKNHKSKVTMITWTEYLCDFLEVINIPELSSHIGTIKRGHYGLLDPTVKLGILRELVYQTIESGMFKKELDEILEQRHALGAARRGEALKEARKKREEKERLKAGADANGGLDEHGQENKKSNMHALVNCSNGKQNGGIGGKRNGVISPEQNDMSLKRHVEIKYQRKNKRQTGEEEIEAKDENDSSGKEYQKMGKDDKQETSERRGAEQRREYYEREMEKRVIRTSSLGKDRHYSRYWWFRRDGRIFIESADSKEWGYYSSKEELDALMGSLNCKGERETSLQKQLEKYYDRICSALQKRSKDIAHRVELEEAVVRRSTRVRAPPRENPASAFLRYVNKWKED